MGWHKRAFIANILQTFYTRPRAELFYIQDIRINYIEILLIYIYTFLRIKYQKDYTGYKTFKPVCCMYSLIPIGTINFYS